MDARELRIGNLVRIENELLVETKGKTYLVSGITLVNEPVKRVMFPNSKYSISLNHTKSLRVYNQFEEFIKPILLTEELLLKCGFINNSLYEHPSFDEFTHSKFKWFEIGDFNGEYFLIDALDQMAGTESPKIKYLHQFQNLFSAITGEELRVNLLNYE